MPSHTAHNSHKRMNHAQNLVVHACPSRIWPFLLTYVMKNHRWIAQELRKDHAQITNKPRTSAHRHEKAPNRANAWLCMTNTRRKATHNQRTVASELHMNRAWFTHELRKECAGGAEVAFIPAYKIDAAAVPWHSRFNSRRQHIVSSSILTISEY